MYSNFSSIMNGFMLIYRIMEVVRQQNEVKYVAYNRVSDSHAFPSDHSSSISFSPSTCRLCILIKLIVRLSKVRRTG